jgi:hypothetical protein
MTHVSFFIFTVMDEPMADDLLIKELHISNLPTLSKKLLDILVKNWLSCFRTFRSC